MVLPRELVADHLDVDLLTHLEPQVADEVLVNPGLKLTHPVAKISDWISRVVISQVREKTYQRVVLPSAPC